MAQDLRSRLTPWWAACALALGGGCGGDGATPASPQAPPAPAPPREVDTAALPADEVVAAILDECHRPLRGRMDRLSATVTLADGAELQLFAELPDRLRVQSAAGRFLLRGDELWRLDAAVAPSADEARRVRALRTLLDAAAFGPLHRATTCRRLGPASFEVAGGGTTTPFTLRAGTLLPAALGDGPDRVTIVDYLRTPTSWVARDLEHPALGRCRVVLEQARLEWDRDFFAPPRDGKVAAPDRVRMVSPGAGGEPRSPTPRLVDSKAMRWVVVPDPGDWPARAAAYRPLHEELLRQEQAIAGFPLLWQEDGRSWLGAPFRARPDGPEFTPPAGWRLRDVPAGSLLCVYPADGDLAQKAAAGEQALRAALAARQLRATGPVTVQPFFHLQEGPPAADKLAAPVVRVAVAVQ